tara:strand:+ start:431 stop:664 length:234 start_codon:yes stop_codon:yes gene_type:complete
MKSKNIPPDIKAKSQKEAQNEIEEIIGKFENNNTNLEDSVDQYNRMMQLNHYIQEKFIKRAKEIRKNTFKKKKKKTK